jgi:hypothetical protein
MDSMCLCFHKQSLGHACIPLFQWSGTVIKLFLENGTLLVQKKLLEPDHRFTGSFFQEVGFGEMGSSWGLIVQKCFTWPRYKDRISVPCQYV